ncbi:MAG: hypothetical protein Q7J27_11730 [Syntrophales bacterium]|nr:hypothetical protein [Syntrophales bacterium]
MRRTELLQEIRIMRFEEVYGVWTERGLSQEEAARILGVCTRTFRRYIDCCLSRHLTPYLQIKLTPFSFPS